MLVLSRKKNESIIINGNIEVKIIDADDGKVRIGIEAPKEIEIHRKEVFDQIAKENVEAAISTINMNQLIGKIIPSNAVYNKKVSIKNKKMLNE